MTSLLKLHGVMREGGARRSDKQICLLMLGTATSAEQPARMERSEIRGCCVADVKPGLRCAPSGLRLLLHEPKPIPHSELKANRLIFGQWTAMRDGAT